MALVMRWQGRWSVMTEVPLVHGGHHAVTVQQLEGQTQLMCNASRAAQSTPAGLSRNATPTLAAADDSLAAVFPQLRLLHIVHE